MVCICTTQHSSQATSGDTRIVGGGWALDEEHWLLLLIHFNLVKRLFGIAKCHFYFSPAMTTKVKKL
jgi:hypothetical protein